ncbi:MAG: hypothetical protein QXK06_02315 [Candidatus Diapherotrites archaeon]
MEKKIESKWLLPAGFILFMAAYGIFFYITNLANAPAENLSEAMRNGCLLEYGESECINERLAVPFFNGGEKTIQSVQITIPTIQGTDIATINEPLEPQKAASVQLTECKKIDSSKNLKAKWCCDKCFESEMNNPSKEIKLKH